MLTTRPKVAELVFQLFGRPLHPELFEVYSTQTARSENYHAKIDITSAGHVVTYNHAGLTLTEIATSAQNPLPGRRRLISCPLKGHRNDEVDYRDNVSYKVSFHLERVEPEVFWAFQEQLTQDSEREGMLHKFSVSERMALGALSYVNVDSQQKRLFVQAFHTFPADYAIVKSQSLFQLT